MIRIEAIIDYNIMRGVLNPPKLEISAKDVEHRATRVESYYRAGEWDEYALGKAVHAGWISAERAAELSRERKEMGEDD